jgi:prevent-host-death family protein
MKKINIHEAKTHLSHYLEEARKGEKMLICKRNRPIAEIRPLVGRSNNPRPIGLAKGTFSVPSSFFEELPEEVLKDFAGEEQ